MNSFIFKCNPSATAAFLPMHSYTDAGKEYLTNRQIICRRVKSAFRRLYHRKFSLKLVEYSRRYPRKYAGIFHFFLTQCTVALAYINSLQKIGWQSHKAIRQLQSQAPSRWSASQHYTCCPRCPRPRLPAPDGPAWSVAERCCFCCEDPCDVSAADAAVGGCCCLARRLPCGGPPDTIGRRAICPDEYGGGWPCSCTHHPSSLLLLLDWSAVKLWHETAELKSFMSRRAKMLSSSRIGFNVPTNIL